MKRAAPHRATRDTAAHATKSTPRGQREQPPRPHRVVIISGCKRGLWGSFSDLGAAASVAARLRQHGMAAAVESDEGAP